LKFIIISLSILLFLLLGCSSEETGPQEYIRGKYSGYLSEPSILISREFFYEINTADNFNNFAEIDTVNISIVNIKSHFDKDYQLTPEEYFSGTTSIEEFINIKFFFDTNDPSYAPKFTCSFKFKHSKNSSEIIFVEGAKGFSLPDIAQKWNPDIIIDNDILNKAQCSITDLNLNNEMCSFKFNILIPNELNSTDAEISIVGEARLKYSYRNY